MADIKTISPTERYKAIADAIREKSGTTELMQPADMPQMIMELSGDAEYTDITYNEDNTITLTDKNGTVHTMECEYSEDGKLMAVSYDGKPIELTYDGDLLVKIGETAVDMENAPATSGATFNVAYGETPPEDTSKLWIKANEPENVSVGSDVDGVESITTPNVLPEKSSNMSCALVGSKVYLFGGYNGSYLNTINVFDTETKNIATLNTTLTSPFMQMGCVAVGTKIYLFGGYYQTSGSNYYSDSILVFDTENETLTRLAATISSYRCRMSCVAVGTKIYLFGGYTNASNYVSTIQVFDTETETINTLSTSLPKSARDMGCAVVGTKIYLFGGSNSTYKRGFTSIWVFDTTNNTIETLSATLESESYSVSCATIGNKIYLFGGYVGNDYCDKIIVFDPKTEILTPLSVTLTIARREMCCAVVGTDVYLFGGWGSSAAVSVIEKFTLTHELTKGDIEIQSGLLNNKFNLINTDNARVEIGVENVYVGNENNEAERVDAYLHNGTEWAVIE